MPNFPEDAMASYYWTDHYGRRWKVCPCLQKWLPAYEKELLRRKLIHTCIDLYQTIGGASASAGTHSTGGAFDSGQYTDQHIWVARQMGADATWRRTRAQGFDITHAHGVLRGCPHNGPARYQIDAVDDGYSGLGRGGRGSKDNGPRPLSGRSWQEGIAWAEGNQSPDKPEPVTTYTIELHKFKWTLPVGKPDELYPIGKKERAPWFVQELPEGIRARVKGGGAHTSGSKYSRSEGREMNANGSKAAWDSSKGFHSMLVTCHVHALTSGKGVVVGQIHDDADDVVMVRVQSGKVYAEFSKGKGKGSEKVLLGSIGIEEKFKYQIVADAKSIRVYFRPLKAAKPVMVERKIRCKGAYYKAGNYYQSTTGEAEVVIHELRVEHTK